MQLRIHPIALYLLALLLFSINFWGLKPVTFLFSDSRGMLLYLATLVLGCVLWSGRASRSFFNSKNNLPVILIAIGILLSFITAKLYYGQTVIRSAIAVRRVLYYLTLPVLLLIRPSLRDVKAALYMFSVLFFLMVLLCTCLHLDLVVLSEEQLMRQEISLKAQGPPLEGFLYVAMAFAFSFCDLFKRVTAKNVALTLLCLSAILLYQNRTTIFACAACVVWFLLTLPNTKRTIKVKVAAVLMAAVVLVLSKDILFSLFEETVSDVSNTDYNRNLSYAYFLTQAPNGLLSVLLGNGFISVKTSPIMEELMNSGIYNSDVGLIGMWSQFGLLPILVFLAACIYPFARKLPKPMQLISIQALCSSLTVAYIFASQTMVWLCLYFYLLVYFSIKKQRDGRFSNNRQL